MCFLLKSMENKNKYNNESKHDSNDINRNKEN